MRINVTIALAILSILMMLPLSWPIWRMIQPMQQVQFPWRWLAVTSAAGAVLAAAGLARFQRAHSSRASKLLLSGAVLVSVTFSLSHSVREAQYLSSDEFRHFLRSVPGTASVNYWVPVWASGNPRQMKQPVEATGRSLSIEKWEPESRRFRLSEGTSKDARVRTYYYPHWQASIDGRPLTTRPDADGALLIDLPKNAATVTLVFQEPPLSRYSAAASSIGWLFIFAAALPLKRMKQPRR
jgi:hypothetical protein